jgi:hypothetical protein
MMASKDSKQAQLELTLRKPHSKRPSVEKAPKGPDASSPRTPKRFESPAQVSHGDEAAGKGVVEKHLKLRLRHDCGQVDDRPSHIRNRDSIDLLDLTSGKPNSAVDGHSRYRHPPALGNGQLDPWLYIWERKQNRRSPV